MALKISIYSASMTNHQGVHAAAFQIGLRRHGIDVDIRDVTDYRPSDLAVMWSHKHERIITGQRAIGARYLVMERGYIGDRLKWTSIGFDGLNGRADFPCRSRTDGSRLDANFPDILKPQRKSGRRGIIMGQVDGDAALAHVDINRWYQEVAFKLRMSGQTAYFRPHPLSKSNPPSRVEVLHGDLSAALANASRVITFNSNSGVDAVISGVPAVAYDEGSMAWDVTSHDVDAPLYRPSSTARRAWAIGLSWCQWTIDEILSGEAWAQISGHAVLPPLSRVG